MQPLEVNFERIRRVCYPCTTNSLVSIQGSRMNVQRFAGENATFQKFAAEMQKNEQLMKQRQNEAMQNAYEQRARDVAATQGRFI